MAEKKKGKKPDYSGNGITIWRNKDKNGNDYLTVQIFGKNGLNRSSVELEPVISLSSRW